MTLDLATPPSPLPPLCAPRAPYSPASPASPSPSPRTSSDVSSASSPSAPSLDGVRSPTPTEPEPVPVPVPGAGASGKRRRLPLPWRARAAFPRRQREPWVTRTFFPYTGAREDWLARALEGARLASRAWLYAARTGMWDHVDGDCLTLAVFDRVYEINLKARPLARPAPPGLVARMRRRRSAEPAMHATVAAWRAETDAWAEGVYREALATLPGRRKWPFAFPPLADALGIVRTLLDLGFRPGVDAAAAAMSYTHCYEMMAGFSPSMLGKWDPHLPMAPPTYDEEQDMLVYK